MKSLHKVLDVIEAVAREGSIGIRELSARTGFPPATIHRMTSTLVDRRYLKRDPVSKRLSLSVQFLELGTKVQQHFSLTAVARPHLEKLMDETMKLALRIAGMPPLAVRMMKRAVYQGTTSTLRAHLDYISSQLSQIGRAHV